MSYTQEAEYVETSAPTSWRIADGKLVRGRQGQEETRRACLGYLRRVGIHYGQTNEGQDYGKLEAVIECSDGLQTVSTTLMSAQTGKPSLMSSISFAEGLLELAKDEYCQVEAIQGTQPNRYGKYNTYAKVCHIDPVSKRPKQTARAERVEGRPLEDYLDDLLEKIKAHPAYSERPQRAEQEDPYADDGPAEDSPFGADTGSHSKEAIAERAMNAYDVAAQKKGWPSLKEAPTEYLELVNKYSEKVRSQTKTKPYATLSAVDADWWKDLLDQLPKIDKVPKVLQPALDRRRNGGDTSIFD